MKNSVFKRRDASCSLSFRDDKIESISSMNIIDGWRCLATANSVLTSFSPSPTFK